MKLSFTHEKDTKGAVRYAEVKTNELDEAIVGTLYVRKSGLRKLGFDSIPQTITIEIGK